MVVHKLIELNEHNIWCEIDLENINKRYVEKNCLRKYDFVLKVEVDT